MQKPLARSWDGCIVSLLDLIEFRARRYLDIVHRFGLVLGPTRTNDPDILRDVWNYLQQEVEQMELPVTKQYLNDLVVELIETNPDKVTLIGANTVDIVGAQITQERSRHHAEAIYKTLVAEVGSLKLFAIPREKVAYGNPKWLTDGVLAKYPDTIDEFQKAGRCFMYDENAACVFHLMRVTDFYLRRVADSLSIPYDARNWQGIGDKIAKTMEQKYHNKTDDWRKAEPFYAEILTDIQAIGRGHRNPALHELEKKYDEREARYMLTVIESFANHVAKRI